MLKKHLTILFLLLMTVGAFAQSIPSGTARYEALGFNPFIMDAATDINRNPAWSTWYRNYAFGDIGRWTSNTDKGGEYVLNEQYAGVNFGLGRQWNIGAVLNREEGQVWGGSFRYDGTWGYQAHRISAPIVPIELLVGWLSTSKKLSLGIAPYYARWSHDMTNTYPWAPSDTTEFDNSSSIMGGTIGVVGKMKGTDWWEANVDARLNKFKNTMTVRVINPLPPGDTSFVTSTYESDGGFEIGANVRGFFMVSKPNKVNLVPYVNFNMFNWKPKLTTTPAVTWTQEFKNMSIKGGVGINMPVLDDGMLAGGITIGYSTSKSTYTNTSPSTSNEYKVTTLLLPQINIGGEWKFNDWLTGRMGYARAVNRQKIEYTATSVPSVDENLNFASDPNQTIDLGLGWHFGRFSLDGLVGERFFQEGPYILGGRTNDLYGILSVSYNFNK